MMSVIVDALMQANYQAASADAAQPGSQDPASLSRLIDVIEPEALPLWSPAPFWWVLLAVVVAWVLLATVWGWKRYRSQAYRRAALAELATMAPGSLSRLPALLKRTALAAYPRKQVASLTGEDWLSFLDRTGATTEFTRGVGRPLLSLAYESTQCDPADARQLIQVASAWIRRHKLEEQG